MPGNIGPPLYVGSCSSDGIRKVVSFKALLFRLLGKDPEAVVVSFLSGPEPLARAMLDEVRQLVPDREHFAVTNIDIPDVICIRPTSCLVHSAISGSAWRRLCSQKTGAIVGCGCKPFA